MKAIIILSIVAVLAWYGFKQYHVSQVNTAENSAPYLHSEDTKCTTADGHVLYGQLPPGTKCQKQESIKSALAISPSPNSDSAGSGKKTFFVAEKYHCDGRTHCSQMTSCEEAKYFLRNCSGVEMDGNHDGVPCERQWCL